MNTLTRGQRVQAVGFLVVGSAIIAGACTWLLGASLFSKPKPHFLVRFAESAAGIDEGTAVRYRGVKKGRVRRITPDYTHDEVEVELEVDPDLLITKTTVARFSSQSLLGPYYIELSGSNESEPSLPPGSLITTDNSTMRRIVEAGTVTMERLGTVLNNLESWTRPENEKRVQALFDSITHLASTTDAAVKDFDPEAARLLKNWADVGGDVRRLLSDNTENLNAMLGETRQLVADLRRFTAGGHLEQLSDEATKTMQSGRADLSRVATSVTNWVNEDRLGKRISDAVSSLERLEARLTSVLSVVESEFVATNRTELAPTLRGFRDTMHDLDELLRVLRDDPSLAIFAEPRREVTIPKSGAPAPRK